MAWVDTLTADIHRSLTYNRSHTLWALVDYFDVPKKPVTPRELAELWVSLTPNEEFQWLFFAFERQMGRPL
jgi:hypothetical protein